MKLDKIFRHIILDYNRLDKIVRHIYLDYKTLNSTKI